MQNEFLIFVENSDSLFHFPELSRLAADTTEFDRQLRSLPTAISSVHRYRPAVTCWHDSTQQHQGFGPRYGTQSLLSTPRGQFTNLMTHSHRPCLYNPSLSMTSMITTNASTYCHPNALLQNIPVYRQYHPYGSDSVEIRGGDNFFGHRRRRSSTGQIHTSADKPQTKESAVATDDHDLTSYTLAFAPTTPHKSAVDLTSIALERDREEQDRETEENTYQPPEWLNAFDTTDASTMTTLTATSVTGIEKNVPCELEQLTATRRQWMLMHEQRERMRSETEASFASFDNQFTMLECEELVPSSLLSGLGSLEGQLEDPFLEEEKLGTIPTTFDKTVGGQLSASTAGGVPASKKEGAPQSPSRTSEALPDAFGIFQKTWLPAFLPWRSRFVADDPTRDPDFAEATSFLPSSSARDIPGPVIQEVSTLNISVVIWSK